MRQNLFVWCH